MHPLDKFRYCPVCGSRRFEVHNEKSKSCGDCGFTYYFNPSAATVAIITNERGEILVCRRGKEPAKGTLDLPGGFVDMYETGEEGVMREIAEEIGIEVSMPHYLFSLPNTYLYSNFLVHTLDSFYECKVKGESGLKAMDDVAESFWMERAKIDPAEFGLDSVSKGIAKYLEKD